MSRGYLIEKDQINRPPPRKIPKMPHDNFYRPIEKERHDHLVKLIRMEGRGDHD